MNSKFSRVKFVTSNPNKFREAKEILGDIIDLIDPGELIEIQTCDVFQLIVHKVRQAYELIGEPVIVEDSGLFFCSWNQLPGAMVKWFEKNVGCGGMIKMLDSFENRKAIALCCIALYDGCEVKVVQGQVQGYISKEPLGSNGFGWDTIFIPEGYNKTFAEMAAQEKNKISHRRKAFEVLKTIF